MAVTTEQKTLAEARTAALTKTDTPASSFTPFGTGTITLKPDTHYQATEIKAYEVDGVKGSVKEDDHHSDLATLVALLKVLPGTGITIKAVTDALSMKGYLVNSLENSEHPLKELDPEIPGGVKVLDSENSVIAFQRTPLGTDRLLAAPDTQDNKSLTVFSEELVVRGVNEEATQSLEVIHASGEAPKAQISDNSAPFVESVTSTSSQTTVNYDFILNDPQFK